MLRAAVGTGSPHGGSCTPPVIRCPENDARGGGGELQAGTKALRLGGPGLSAGQTMPTALDPMLAAFCPQSALCRASQPISTPALACPLHTGLAAPRLSTPAPASPRLSTAPCSRPAASQAGRERADPQR